MIKFLDLYHQYRTIQPEIDMAIRSTIEKSAFIGGESVKNFEEAFAQFQQASCCVGVGNGTDALEIAIEALNLPPKSEIIVPANSFVATAESVTRTGHHVVFADVNPATYTLDPDDVNRRITSRTKAVIAVHLYGHPCDMDGILALASQYGLRILEDCAQAHGAEYRGKRVGVIGDIGAFSFYPGKNLGAYGDAGAILSNNPDIANRCRMIANHGRAEKYNHLIEGRNSRLDGLQAAILEVKLKYLEGWLDRRNAIAGRYIRGLWGIPQITLPIIDANARHVFHLFVIRIERRDELRQYLKAAGIESGVHYPVALPKLAAYKYIGQYSENMCANKIDATLLSLPMGEHLNDDQVDTVIGTVRDYCKSIIS